MSRKIADYTNGNVHITLYDDGTRVMETEDDEFEFEYPTNVDMTITHRCHNECPYCYLGCNSEGKHADILNVPFLDTLLSGQELAINFNNCDHPQLIEFLHKMKNRGIFVNGTVNQADFERHFEFLKMLSDRKLIWGIGVSLNKPTKEFLSKANEIPNVVVHVINGILSADDIEEMRGRNIKLLILGYKDIGRGADYINGNTLNVKARQRYLKDVLPTMFNHFVVISFDNLALEQLNVRELITEEQWSKCYQGDEGTSTFAIDLVTGKFSMNSMVTDPKHLHNIKNDIREMFDVVKAEIAA